MMFLLLMLLACGREDPCAAMCSAATRVYGGCLTSWDATWRDAGFADERDHFHSCETWAWEMRMLEKNALRRGNITALGHVDEHCSVKESELLSETMTCDEWSAIDWEAPLWSE